MSVCHMDVQELLEIAMRYATAMSEFLFVFIMFITIIMYTIMNKTSDY